MWQEFKENMNKEVLIETLWNVNIYTRSFQMPVKNRINRNIVECKSQTVTTVVKLSVCINRNIVECK